VTQPEPITLPLELLLERLKGAGISLDPARRLRLLRVLEREGGSLLGAPDAFTKLKFLLAPVIARTGKEQELVYGIFQRLEQEWKEEADGRLNAWTENLADDPPPPPGTKKDTEPVLKRYWWLLAMLALLSVGYIVRELTKPLVPKVSIENRPEAIYREGKPLGLTLSQSDNKRKIDQGHWEVRHAQTKELEYRDSADILTWPASKHGDDKTVLFIGTNSAGSDTAKATIHIHCAEPPIFEPIFPKSPFVLGEYQVFEVNIDTDADAEWVFSDTTLLGRRVKRKFEETGLVNVRLNVWRKGFKDDCYDIREAQFMVGSDKPYFRQFALKKDFPKFIQILKLRFWLLSLLPLLLTLFFLWRWWEEYHAPGPLRSLADIEKEYPIVESAPYFIPYLPQEGKITVPRDFFRIAEVLRRREESARRNFDVSATVNATIASGGFMAWRDSVLSRPTEYLFIVTRPSERNQQGRLFERITSFLKKRDVPMEAFFHDGRFERFWNKDNAEGLNLAELYRLYPQHRLVLLGDAHGLVDNHATEMLALRAPLLAELVHWKRRLLLTPEPVSGWQFQEALLHRHFLVFPADTDGILEGFDLLDRTEEHDPSSFDRWQAQLLQLHVEPSHRYRRWETVQDHFDYLAETELVQKSTTKPSQKTSKDWLCALAVSPQPDWALTIALGRAIGVEVTHDRLLALTRIPWLSANQPDTGLRIQLLSHLSPEDEIMAREAFLEELEAVREQTKAGFAETERRSNLAVQHFALDPFDPTHQKLISDLKKIGLLSGSQQAELQHIFKTKVKPFVPENSLYEWLDKMVLKPTPKENLDYIISALCFSFSFLILSWAYIQEHKAPTGQLNEPDKRWFDVRYIDDEALQLNNQAVALWSQIDSINQLHAPDSMPIAKTAWPRDEDNLKRASAADSLLNKAILLRKSNYPLADANRSASRFNRAAIQFNWYLDTKQGVEALAAIGQEFSASQIEKDSNSLKKNPIALSATHGSGLCSYFQKNNTAALNAYQNLIQCTDSLYFDTLYNQMPVNLQTLLQKDELLQQQSRWLRVLVMDARSGKPVPDAQVLLRNRSPLSADGQGRAQQQFNYDPGNIRAAARVTAPKYLDWTGSLLLRANRSQVDTIRLRPANQSAIAALAASPPTKDLLAEAFRDFQFDDSLEVHLDEAERMLRWLGAKDIQTNKANAEPFAYGNLPSGYVAIWSGTYGHRDRYGLRFGKPDLKFIPSNDTYMEVFRTVRWKNIPMPVMLPVPGGKFTMGSPDGDKGGHLVEVSSFIMGETEVNFAAFDAFCNATKREKPIAPAWGRGDGPAINVDWYDAVEYCNWLSQQASLVPVYSIVKTNRDPKNLNIGDEKKWTVTVNNSANGFRLPTEAEWEYAARGGQAGLKTNFTYAGSDAIDEVAWYIENSSYRARPAALKKPNQLGLYDMSGNVWEWCSDWYQDYPEGSQSNPIGPIEGFYRVQRGGSWSNYPQYCRVAYRGSDAPGVRDVNLGFRLARTP